jgi:hypothetical protein
MHTQRSGAQYRRSRGALALLVGALIVTGCSGDDDPGAAPSPTASEPPAEQTTPAPEPEPTPEPVWPLTGLAAPDGVADRPVVVVKVDNTGNARPQEGLAEADIIVEEPVEGGLTRLAAMYHSSLPDHVVPVRSIRTTDIGLVGPTSGVLVASGGASRVLAQMEDAGIPVLAEGTAGFSRDPARPNLYSVTVDLDAALGAAPDREAPSVPYLQWADTQPAGETVSQVAIRFSGSHTTTHTWTGEAWLRDGDMTDDGQEFAAANLLVLHVTTRDAGYTDPGGNPVDEVVFEAGGEALLLAGDTAVEAAWNHGGDDAVFTLANAAGEQIAVPPGKTWIALVPERGAVTTE